MTTDAEALPELEEEPARGRWRFRTVLFWFHLCCGVLAGLVIGWLALTGALLVLERPLVALSTGSVVRSDPSGSRLPIEALLAAAQRERPGTTPSAVTLSRAPDAPVWVALGRAGGVALDPTTGQRVPSRLPWVRDAFQRVNELHRWFALSGDARSIGEGITGAATLIFLCLVLTGPLLWLPRRWTRASLRSIGWFRSGLRGRARDWNWHHVLGAWCVPALVVLSSSGVVMSYRWANDAVYRATGSPLPPPGRPTGPKVEAPPSGVARVPLETLVAEATQRVPAWRELTVRFEAGAERRLSAVSMGVKEEGTWPLFASVQLWADPFSGRILREERYGDQSAGRKIRMWLRFLHTGEALGWPGQLVAATTSLGAAVLVWTGLALALRRLLRSWRSRVRSSSSPEASPL
jgi:uncharacterized iron-regulated membrane protein